MSHDQRLLYEYCIGIDNGHVIDRWASWKIGPTHHARWLTLAIRILCLYTRQSKPSLKLKKLVTYIVKIYAPTWFEIKKSSHLKDSPQIIFNVISKLKSFDYTDIAKIAKQDKFLK